MTTETNTAALADWHANEAEQRRRFLGSSAPNGPALRKLRDEIEFHKQACDLLRAGAAKVPESDLRDALKCIPENDDDLPDNESAFVAGVRWAQEQIEAALATPPAPDAGVVGCGSAVCPHGAECVHAQKGTQ